MTECNGNVKRVTCKRPRPNQHFKELLESLCVDATKKGSSILPVLKEAISSLDKYPLPLTSGSDCAILKGFDKRLCQYIDSHLNESKRHKKSRVGDNGQSSHQIDCPLTSGENKDSEMTSNAKKNRRKNKIHETYRFNESNQQTDGELPIVDLTDSKPGNNNNLQKLRNKNSMTECLDNKNTGIEELEIKNNLFCDSIEELKETINYVNYSKCSDWDSMPYLVDRPRCTSNLTTIYQPGDRSNEDSHQKIIEIDSSSEDESIDQPIDTEPKCIHNVDQAQQCDDPITSAAATFQKYYDEKTKRDAEEISKCVLPRKLYKPAYRSGAYAILVALLEQRTECPYRDCLTKDELIQKAQKHTDQSFTVPKLYSNYTAWTNAKRLINKGMIQITNFENTSEDFYMLTAMGRAVATELVKENTPEVTVNDIIFHGQWNDRVPSVEAIVLAPPPPVASIDEDQSSVFIEMPPGTFDVFLLIDKRENLGINIPPGNTTGCCRYEARSLNIGDFIWVARSRKTGQELVLPYIVERKRMDDLASSIKDGRFHEQKFRLRKCGLENVMYLVENFKKNVQYSLPMGTLTQAMVNTSILDEFNMVKTGSLNHTFAFLAKFSEKLVQQYLPLVLRGCNRDTEGKELMTFEFFNKFSCKNKPLTVRDTFIKMLLQLKGLSVEKALAITNTYSTPRLLMKAYARCTEKEGELLLAGLKFNEFSRNVGPGVSRTVYKLFSDVKP